MLYYIWFWPTLLIMHRSMEAVPTYNIGMHTHAHTHTKALHIVLISKIVIK